jgi:DNA adenine methylase
MTAARPFLKWAGGKKQLLPELLRRAPKTFGTYHEPFLGGGAFFFALRPERAALSDINWRLATTWSAVRNSLGAVSNLLVAHADRHSESYFYSQRKRQLVATSNPAELAAWMIYLNKTCFNGLYRVNNKGEFNTPFGKYKNPPICDHANLRACSSALGVAAISCAEFDTPDPRVPVMKGDFVYFDPPYVPVKKDSFTTYTPGGFGAAEHTRLRDYALRLKSKGVYVLISNSGAELVGRLYSGNNWQVDEVRGRRSINSKGSGRGAVCEYLIR